MPFIGVIAKESESNFIKKEVTKNAKCKKLEVLNINKKNILKDSEIITYGLNQKATITMSSIKSENILICVQKNFKNYYGKIVEEQEVNVEITKNNLKKISNTMAIFTILTIFGEKLKKI